MIISVVLAIMAGFLFGWWYALAVLVGALAESLGHRCPQHKSPPLTKADCVRLTMDEDVR